MRNASMVAPIATPAKTTIGGACQVPVADPSKSSMAAIAQPIAIPFTATIAART
jgi:hypothetical protein